MWTSWSVRWFPLPRGSKRIQSSRSEVALSPNFKKLDAFKSYFYRSVFSDPRIARGRDLSFMREASKHLDDVAARVAQEKQLLEDILYFNIEEGPPREPSTFHNPFLNLVRSFSSLHDLSRFIYHDFMYPFTNVRNGFQSFSFLHICSSLVCFFNMYFLSFLN